MKRILCAFVGAGIVMTGSPAFAWGEPGHQAIGSLAWAILKQPGHANARMHIQAILNSNGRHSLADAATWADCVRDVKPASGGGYKLTYVTGLTPKVCTTAYKATKHAETAAMITYVSNNWSQCDYGKPGAGACELTYHFVDVPYQHGSYGPTELSASAHDAVSIIGEAVYYLKNGADQPAAFVKFTNAREALFVLAHLVGDIHQPLHVGAVYLDPQGNVVDPGHDEALGKSTATRGGNSIFDGASAAQKKPELHGEWDKIAASLGTAASPALVAEARQNVAADSGDAAGWPAQWASESVALARDQVFSRMTYAAAAGGKWTFTAPAGYAGTRATIQRLQLEKAGVRLAALLEAIWPG